MVLGTTTVVWTVRPGPSLKTVDWTTDVRTVLLRTGGGRKGTVLVVWRSTVLVMVVGRREVTVDVTVRSTSRKTVEYRVLKTVLLTCWVLVIVCWTVLVLPPAVTVLIEDLTTSLVLMLVTVSGLPWSCVMTLVLTTVVGTTWVLKTVVVEVRAIVVAAGAGRVLYTTEDVVRVTVVGRQTWVDLGGR